MWDQATPDERRGYIRELVDHIVLKPPGRGRPKGIGIGQARGKGGYFKDPMGTVIPHWKGDLEQHPGAADGSGDEPAA